MDFPAGLQATIETEGEIEYGNPTLDFGDRTQTLIFNETGETIPEDLKHEFNGWQDVWLNPQFSWRDFVNWVIAKIIAWWKSLFD